MGSSHSRQSREDDEFDEFILDDETSEDYTSEDSSSSDEEEEVKSEKKIPDDDEISKDKINRENKLFDKFIVEEESSQYDDDLSSDDEENNESKHNSDELNKKIIEKIESGIERSKKIRQRRRKLSEKLAGKLEIIKKDKSNNNEEYENQLLEYNPNLYERLIRIEESFKSPLNWPDLKHIINKADDLTRVHREYYDKVGYLEALYDSLNYFLVLLNPEVRHSTKIRRRFRNDISLQFYQERFLRDLITELISKGMDPTDALDTALDVMA